MRLRLKGRGSLKLNPILILIICFVKSPILEMPPRTFKAHLQIWKYHPEVSEPIFQFRKYHL